MGEGKLGYKFNGEDFGYAFQERCICQGPIFIAIAFKGKVESIIAINHL